MSFICIILIFNYNFEFKFCFIAIFVVYFEFFMHNCTKTTKTLPVPNNGLISVTRKLTKRTFFLIYHGKVAMKNNLNVKIM